MMRSLKNYSRVTTIFVFVAGLVSFLGVDGLKGFVPLEYQYLIPTVVMVAGYVLTQYTEEARVVRAEELVRERYVGDLNPEYTVSGDSGDGV